MSVRLGRAHRISASAWASTAARISRAHEAAGTGDGCRSARDSPPGWYLHAESAGRSRRRRWPSLLPSNRLTCVTRTPVRQRLVVHREAVVLAGDLDPPGREVLHRLVGAAMAAVELVGARRPAPAPAAGGRGRCRTPACPRPARPGSPAPRSRRSPPGRRGRWRGTRRPARGAGCPRRSRSPAPPSPGSRQPPGSAGCCAWRRNRPRRRGAAAPVCRPKPSGQAHSRLVPGIGLRAGDLLREVHALQPRPGRAPARAARRGRTARRPDRPARRSAAPPSRMRSVSARVSTPAMPGHVLRPQPGIERLGARASCDGSVTSCFTTRPRAAIVGRLDVLGVGADIADMRER